MKSDVQAIVDQMAEAIDPVLGMTKVIYDKMSNEPELWAKLARCSKVAVDAFEKEGFTRTEAVAMATAAMHSIGGKKG
jgi:metal-dependent amidase/aminoacylase/carboxypeptidase family protein